MIDSPQDSPDYWLGERSEYVVTDCDGRLRACHLLGRAQKPSSERDPGGRRYLLLRVDPPLRTAPPMTPLPGGEAEQIVVSERLDWTNLEELDHGSLSVLVFTVQDPQAFAAGDLDRAGLSPVLWGSIARDPSQLPRTPEEHFDEMQALVAKFASREGHLNVPDDHRENGQRLSSWINNMRFMQAHGELRREWVERLEAVPGWTWRSGDEIVLMTNFARREGHTVVPLDHHEEGHPLGRWAQERRKSYARGWLHPDDLRRTEAIPHWHW